MTEGGPCSSQVRPLLQLRWAAGEWRHGSSLAQSRTSGVRSPGVAREPGVARMRVFHKFRMWKPLGSRDGRERGRVLGGGLRGQLGWRGGHRRGGRSGGGHCGAERGWRDVPAGGQGQQARPAAGEWLDPEQGPLSPTRHPLTRRGVIPRWRQLLPGIFPSLPVTWGSHTAQHMPHPHGGLEPRRWGGPCPLWRVLRRDRPVAAPSFWCCWSFLGLPSLCVCVSSSVCSGHSRWTQGSPPSGLPSP